MEENGNRMKGSVKWFNDSKGFGYITPDDDDTTQHLVAQMSWIRSDGFQSLGYGESVQYVIEGNTACGYRVHYKSISESFFQRHPCTWRQPRRSLWVGPRGNGTLFPGLVDDVGKLILKRTSWEDLVPFCTVSKRWRLALRPREVVRQVLYVRIQTGTWFAWHPVCRSQQAKLLEKPDFLTQPHPPINLQMAGSAFAVIHGDICMFGGRSNQVLLKNVRTFDCKLGIVEDAPKMRVGRDFAAAQVVWDIIYVFGGFLIDSVEKSKNWMEKLDLTNGYWNKGWVAVHCPDEVKEKVIYATCVVDSEIYAMTCNGWMIFDTVTEEWRIIYRAMINLRWGGKLAVVREVIYCYDSSCKIWGYNVLKDEWKELRGNLPVILSGVTISSLNGRLCVVWEVKVRREEMKIMCAMIEVGEGSDGELYGSVVCSYVAFRLHPGSVLMHSLSV